MKTEAYSWRLSTDLKTALEREASSRKITLAAALDLATREWLQKSSASSTEDAEQLRLQKAASAFIGVWDGGDADASVNVSKTVRKRLQQRRARAR